MSTGVVILSSLAEIRAQNTEEQRLTESGNDRSEELLVMPTEQLTN